MIFYIGVPFAPLRSGFSGLRLSALLFHFALLRSATATPPLQSLTQITMEVLAEIVYSVFCEQFRFSKNKIY